MAYGATLRDGQEIGSRCDVEDAAAAVRAHDPRSLLAGEEHGAEIDLEERIPVALGDLVGRPAHGHARAVDEDVDAAEGGVDVTHEPLDRGDRAHVDRERRRLRARRRERGGCLGQVRARARRERDARARAVQHLRNAEPDAAAAADHERREAAEVEGVGGRRRRDRTIVGPRARPLPQLRRRSCRAALPAWRRRPRRRGPARPARRRRRCASAARSRRCARSSSRS